MRRRESNGKAKPRTKKMRPDRPGREKENLAEELWLRFETYISIPVWSDGRHGHVARHGVVLDALVADGHTNERMFRRMLNDLHRVFIGIRIELHCGPIVKDDRKFSGARLRQALAQRHSHITADGGLSI